MENAAPPHPIGLREMRKLSILGRPLQQLNESDRSRVRRSRLPHGLAAWWIYARLKARPMRHQLPRTVLCIIALATAPALGQASDTGLSRAQAFARAGALKAVGEKMFFDASLSASGSIACATCHDPNHAFGPANDRAVQVGGKDGRQPGLRAVPSLKYLQVVPRFTEHFHESEDEGDASADNGPTGGLMWDGRADRGRDQARLPLFSPFEMANSSSAALAGRVRPAPYAKELRKIIGEDQFSDDESIVAAVAEALEAFEQDERFYPYSSKYDAYLAGKEKLSPQEARGLVLFNDPAKGNCNSCHRSERSGDATPPQFTDYGLIAIGVPRNRDIPANADPKFFDLGACGPLRTDLVGREEYCGLFKTPSLRNVALRQTFFHNGLVHSLRDAIAFYVERDTEPEKWFKDSSGKVQKFDDLPAQYQGSINSDPPFGARPGNRPALSPDEINAIVAFLQTLTDGYAAAR
jgi:cytochrome c peroxidase